MNRITQKASAGTMESSDVYVELEPCDRIEITLESVVEGQFGDSIRAAAHDVLRELGVTGARVRLVDRGALECVLRARLETAVLRAKGE